MAHEVGYEHEKRAQQRGEIIALTRVIQGIDKNPEEQCEWWKDESTRKYQEDAECPREPKKREEREEKECETIWPRGNKGEAHT